MIKWMFSFNSKNNDGKPDAQYKRFVFQYRYSLVNRSRNYVGLRFDDFSQKLKKNKVVPNQQFGIQKKV